MKRRKRLYFIGVFLIAAFFGLWLLSQRFWSPSASDVSSMSAALVNRPDDGAVIPEFELPKAYYQTVLDSLNGSSRDFYPPKWEVLGSITIRLSTGSILVDLFLTGKNSGAFRSNGSYYRGASDSEFVQLIEAASHHKNEP